jgi:type I site-specific restriction endonuclease
MNKRDEITEFFGEPISVYTSEQAEADGILIKTGHPLINYITHTVFERCIEPFVTEDICEANLTKKLINSAISEIRKLNKQDWFYNIQVRGWDLFCCQNETGGYTLMFPEDY